MLRLIKFLWSVSVIGTLFAMLYIYASLPEQVMYYDTHSLSRDNFFYVSLVCIALSNFIFFALSKNTKHRVVGIRDLLKKWYLGLAVIINLLFILILNLIFLANSGEQFDFSNIGYLAYVLIGVLIIWVIGLPIFMVKEVKMTNN